MRFHVSGFLVQIRLSPYAWHASLLSSLPLQTIKAQWKLLKHKARVPIYNVQHVKSKSSTGHTCNVPRARRFSMSHTTT